MRIKLSIIFLVVAIIFFLWCVYQGDKKLTTMEAEVASLDKSIITLQEFTIQHDQLIYHNMLTLYQSIAAPTKDIELLEDMIISRKQLWDVVK